MSGELALAVEGQLERLGSPVTVRRTTGVLDFVTASRGAVTTTDVATVAVRRRKIQRDKEADALFAEELLYLMAARPFSGVFAPADADLVIDGTRSYRVKSVRTRERSGVVIAYEAAVDGGGDGVPVVPTPSGGGSSLMQFVSGQPIDGNGTYFLGSDGFDLDEGEVALPVPDGQALEIQVSATADPSPGTFTYTVRKGTAQDFSDMANTSLTVALSGTTRKGKLESAISYADQQLLSVRLVIAGGAPKCKHKVTVAYLRT